MEFRGTDVRVYEMILRIMEEFDLSPDDLEAYQKEERRNSVRERRRAELKRRLEMAPDKQMVPQDFVNKWCHMHEPIKPDDWRGFKPMC